MLAGTRYAGFDRTYEGLKLIGVAGALRDTPRFDRTYEGLKPPPGAGPLGP